MARQVLVCESFSQYPSNSGLWTKRGWNTSLQTQSVPELSGRYASVGPAPDKVVYFLGFPRVAGGFRSYRNSPYTGDLFRLQSSSTTHLTVSVNTAGQITVTRVSTALPPSRADLWHWNAWNTVLFDLYVHDTIGSLTVIVNGETVASVSGVDTKNGTPTTVTNCWLTWQFWLADLWMVGDDSDTTFPWSGNPPLKPYAIIGQFPNADGASNDWTPNGATNRWECVDEPAMDSDTTYVEGANAGDTQHFAFPNLPANAKDPAIVQITQEIRRTDVAERPVQVGIRSGGVNYPDGAVIAPDTYAIVQSKYLTDPATDTVWTTDAAQASQSLVRVAG